MNWESAGPIGSIGHVSGSRVLPVSDGVNTFRFVCQSVASGGSEVALVNEQTMTLVFVGD